jgi:hypothetical protein
MKSQSLELCSVRLSLWTADEKKELVTEALCWYYKSWTVDFVKVTNKACFYFEKQIFFQSMTNLQTCFYCYKLP